MIPPASSSTDCYPTSVDRRRPSTKRARASGITNDPNDWATEHDKPSYIYDLLCSIVTVSMRTLDIVEGLPELDL